MTMMTGPYYYSRGPSDDEMLDDLAEAVSLTGEILGQLSELESAGISVEDEYPQLFGDVIDMAQRLQWFVQGLADGADG